MGRYYRVRIIHHSCMLLYLLKWLYQTIIFYWSTMIICWLLHSLVSVFLSNSKISRSRKGPLWSLILRALALTIFGNLASRCLPAWVHGNPRIVKSTYIIRYFLRKMITNTSFSLKSSQLSNTPLFLLERNALVRFWHRFPGLNEQQWGTRREWGTIIRGPGRVLTSKESAARFL